MFPSKKETISVLICTALFAILTQIFIGLRPEHYFMIVLFLVLFFVSLPTRKLAVGLLPFVVFGISYDWMRVFPNYEFHSVDIEGLYNLEKSLFGIHDNGVLVTLCEYFQVHNAPFFDFLAGLFYFGWVPVPITFALYLYISKQRIWFLHFSLAFLFVNLLGFTIYYIHPAAPPWYAIEYGFDFIQNTPGNMAGLSRFDSLLGIELFSSIYGRNANVFAALPSLHSAYLLIVLFYASRSRINRVWLVLIAVFLMGIWFTAVYTSHHYVVDVLCGILCAIVGILLFEKVLMKIPFFKSFFKSYSNYIA